MKDKKILYLIIGVILLLIISIVLFFLLNKKNKDLDLDIVEEEGIAFVDNVISLPLDNEYQLEVTYLNGKTKEESIIYSVDNENIAIVNSNGLLKALNEGTCTVTAITTTGIKTDAEVVVYKELAAVESPIIAIKNIEIDKKEITLKTGETYKITTKVIPSNANDKNIYWETNDSRIATVNDEGIVNARTAGKTVLTGYAGDISESITVTVTSPEVTLSEIILSPNFITLAPGDSYQLKATLIPNNVTNQSISYSSSNTKVVTVSSTGLLKAIGNGTATVTVSSNGKTSKTQIVIQARNTIIQASSISLDKDNVTLKTGETLKLNAIVSPSNATNKSYLWTSSNNNVVSVSSNGELKAINQGTVIVTVKTMDGKSATCQVRVISSGENNDSGNNNPNLPTEVLLNVSSLNLQVGKIKQLKATVLPLSANQNVEWFSGMESVATITKEGIVKAIKPGTTTISAITSNGKIGKVNITVGYPPITPSTAATKYAPGKNISSSVLNQINDHLAFYIEEAGRNAPYVGLSVNRAKTVAAAYFLIYNPYYKVMYNLYGRSSIGKGWYNGWGDSYPDSTYYIRGIDCNSYIRWCFYQVFNKDIQTIGGPMRTRNDSGLSVSEITAVAKPGDVLRKDKNLMGGSTGHVAFVYSVNNDGTLTIAHASGLQLGITLTTYRKSARTNFNYLYSMQNLYGD